ncbi:GPCR, rhodopsin-like, 7TM,G protein-coupled receptor, rhodopsin-like [Cinara cedri]|uniref:GPCR, rhodopsin-like, 7TM,G protein-coupled receptor, rhodopsin-like n=1 Tax=Cinara cedri TaxID=506608 RepID=A0A5E4NP86_9HEMI|nr:GPCR, rhodopsin-like, 7TM,G protein-coupled receptor, rhodopsin-like [Cinara cedri]
METVGRNATTALSPSTTQSSPRLNDTEEPVAIVALKLIIFIVGIFGNLLALYILYRTRSTFNQKHGFMLRCLATNDCILLVYVLVRLCVKLLWPNTVWPMWTCRIRGLAVFFELNSGGVATMMAVERWVALTKPFFYREHVSLCLLKRVMIVQWIGIFCSASVPCVVFGLYEDKSTCLRYRNAKNPLDVLFTNLYFSYGVFLCVVIIFMNVAVTRALCMKDGSQNNNVLVRRDRRGILINGATREERTFARLMLLLSVAFFTCWIPQMITIPLARFISDENQIKPLFFVADLLSALHFVMDPYLYVLQHCTLVKSICLNREARKSSSVATVTMGSRDCII